MKREGTRVDPMTGQEMEIGTWTEEAEVKREDQDKDQKLLRKGAAVVLTNMQGKTKVPINPKISFYNLRNSDRGSHGKQASRTPEKSRSRSRSGDMSRNEENNGRYASRSRSPRSGSERD